MKYNHWLPKLLNVNAIVINRTIYFAMAADKVSDRLMQHEKEHVRQQQKEVFLFYPKYFKEYIKNLIKYKNHNKAYRYISYEVEARKAEKRRLSKL